MELLRNKYLLWPIALLSAIFCLDKVAFLPAVKEQIVFYAKIEPVFYESRYWLFDQLSEEYEDRKAKGQRLGLILGSSRSAEFDSDFIATQIPGSYTYNFSAPFSCPAYYYYWLKRNLDAGHRPAFVIVETDPIVMGMEAIQYSLNYSYDPEFVLSHADLFRNNPSDEWRTQGNGFSISQAETYLLKQSFGFYKYPLKFSNIEANNEILPLPGKEGLRFMIAHDFRDEVIKIVRDANRIKLGGIPNLLLVQIPDDQMRVAAEEDVRKHLAGYNTDPTQIIFLRKLFELAAYEKIPVIAHWPVSSDPFYQAVKQRGLLESVESPIKDMIAQANSKANGRYIYYANPSEDPTLTCRAFTDSFHLSGRCYENLTRILLSRLPQNLHE